MHLGLHRIQLIVATALIWFATFILQLHYSARIYRTHFLLFLDFLDLDLDLDLLLLHLLIRLLLNEVLRRRRPPAPVVSALEPVPAPESADCILNNLFSSSVNDCLCSFNHQYQTFVVVTVIMYHNINY